jgi:DnaJ-class molecular chaperone
MEQHYRTLGLSTNATDEEVHVAYCELVKKYHPDKSNASSQEEFVNIVAAHDAIVELNGTSDKSSKDPFEDVFQSEMARDILQTLKIKPEEFGHFYNKMLYAMKNGEPTNAFEESKSFIATLMANNAQTICPRTYETIVFFRDLFFHMY